MIKLKCIKDVIMVATGEVAFKARQEYGFNIKSNGDIQQFKNNTVHIFYSVGQQAWTNYFEYVLEEAK
jgi:hypothetical protein